MELTHQQANAMWEYNKIDGILIWRERNSSSFDSSSGQIPAVGLANIWNSRFAGKAAGNINKETGYVLVKANKKNYRVHRLVWFMETGYWPKFIDHINGDRADNRWENLREVTKGENSKNIGIASNNTSGRTGVFYDKRDRGWYSSLQVDGKRYSKRFDTFESAVSYRLELEKDFGFMENNRRSIRLQQ